MLISNLLKKLKKILAKKDINRKMEFWLFITVCKRFWPIIFLFVNLFCYLLTDSKSESNSDFFIMVKF
jgi:hypothetical protein